MVALMEEQQILGTPNSVIFGGGITLHSHIFNMHILTCILKCLKLIIIYILFHLNKT